MHPSIRGASARLYARVAGWLYLAIIAIGIFADAIVPSKVVVSGNAAATVRNILDSQSLWRTAIAGEILVLICAVITTFIFYALLRPVNQNLAFLALLFNLVSMPIEGASWLCNIAPLVLLGGSSSFKLLEPQQLQGLVTLSLGLKEYGFGISLIFFGIYCLIIGYLLFKSGYFPKTLGVLYAIAGLCYLVNSFAMLLAPALQDQLFPLILVPSFVGELSFCVWLIVVGVNVSKWDESTR